MRGGGGLFFDRPTATRSPAGRSNPPTSTNVTVRYGSCRTLGSAGLTTKGAPALVGRSSTTASCRRRRSGTRACRWRCRGRRRSTCRTSASTASTRLQTRQHQCHRLRCGVPARTRIRRCREHDAGRDAVPPGSHARVSRDTGPSQQQWDRGWRTYHSIQLSFNRRFNNGVSFGFNDTIGLYDHQSTGGASSAQRRRVVRHSRPIRPRPTRCSGPTVGRVHILMKANFVWDLPDLSRRRQATRKVLGYVLNDWQLSGIWTGSDRGRLYGVGFNYQSGGGSPNLTGSPDYGARVQIVGDPAAGCSSDDYRQFNTAAFQGPPVGSVGLESPETATCALLHQQSPRPVVLAHRSGSAGAHTIQMRVDDFFNAPNAAAITGRNTTMNLSSPVTPGDDHESPYNANGDLMSARSTPRGAGFGVANDYQTRATVQ